jgi:hypothetical protein
MTDKEPDCSFVLNPGQKKRCNAGFYDRENCKPHYELFVEVPEHVRHQVETKQFLIKTGDGHLWIWDLNNESTWPAIITITSDGKLIRDC